MNFLPSLRVRAVAASAGCLVAASLVLMAAGCSSGAPDSDSTVAVPVQVAAVSVGPLQQWVRTQAVLYPLQQAVITPKITAPVSRFYVQRGDHVHAGELLAVLENKDLAAAAEQAQGQLQAAEAAYATATASTIPADLKKAQLDVTAAKKAFENAQRIYTNDQDMFRQGAIARSDLDQAGVALTEAQNSYELAEQHLRAVEQGGGHTQALKEAQGQLRIAQGQAAAAEAMLGYSRILSPIDGVVTDRPMFPGELATPSAPLMTIMNLDSVVARAPLPASQAALLKPGATALFTVPGAGQPLPARVTVVSPATDVSSTTIEVWAQARNPGGELRPGTSVHLSMLSRTLPHALIVPADAVLTDDSGQASVMVVGADHKAHQTNVTLGVREPDRVQIVTGLTAGQQVVTVGAYGLPDQAQVQVVAPAKSSASEGDAQ